MGTWSNRSRVNCSGVVGGVYAPDCEHACYECPPGSYCDDSPEDGGGGVPNILPDGPCDPG